MDFIKDDRIKTLNSTSVENVLGEKSSSIHLCATTTLQRML